MYHTKIRTMRDLRNNTAEVMKTIEAHDQVVITNRGREAAVLIDYEDFAGYEDYIHEVYVRCKLEESKKRAADPRTEWLSHAQFWRKARAAF